MEQLRAFAVVPPTKKRLRQGCSAMHLWAGHECTVNRIANDYYDQSALSGHDQRSDDIDRFAALGVTALRFPVLWERVAPDGLDHCDWSWTDARLDRMRKLGMRPIIGLVHHGSGPRYTGLLEDNFATLLAAYARIVAERYPWVTDWTPINEPVTTARFSALYGHWYPHKKDEASFWQALINQIDATCLAMRVIRDVIPDARLIQTEDIGCTLSTPSLQHQAHYNNERRWAGWDLLCGRVNRDHALWDRLCTFGFERSLQHFLEDNCRPDVFGINHYLTSDRFLDDRVELYPPHMVGGCPNQRYSDTEVVRVAGVEVPGIAGAITETWQRYGGRIALTEVHNGCTREDQMRWFAEAWETAVRLSNEGIDIEAVTAWSLLGSYDWNSLLTQQNGQYEVGVYDIRRNPPRPTALVPLLREVAAGHRPNHPILSDPGWWRRDTRLQIPAHPGITTHRSDENTISRASSRPILITGATGTLGKALARACQHRGLAHIVTQRDQLSLSDETGMRRLLDAYRPWAVINAAGWVRVDDAEYNPAACFAANCVGSVALAKLCCDRDISYTTFSSDLVFDGTSYKPYDENAKTNPLNIYGQSKANADRALLALSGDLLLIRTSAFFAACDPHNFAASINRSLLAGERFEASSAYTVSPTYVPDLVNSVLDLVIDRECGLWHLANDGAVTWYELAQMIAGALRFRQSTIVAIAGDDPKWSAKRPQFVPLTSLHGRIMPSIADAVERFAQQSGGQDNRM